MKKHNFMDFYTDQEHNERNAYKDITKNAKEYANLQLQLLKLNMVGSLSQVVSYIVALVVASVLILAAFLYFSMIVVVWMQQLTGSWIYGFLTMGVVFVVLCILFFLCRKKFLLNPIVKKMSSILFSNEAEMMDMDEFQVKSADRRTAEKEVEDE